MTIADKYRLLSLLGSGGMGSVYKAEQLGLGRAVAVKLLHRELIHTRFEWFRSEAMAASRINHPHAVAIYDFGVTDDAIPYLVMEWLRGSTLTEVLQGERLELDRVVSIGTQVLSAVAEAHACGVVHCDLTGDNIIVERLRAGGDSFAKVIDFGLARLFERPGERRVIGTPEYMAPEQVRGERIDPRTDVYSVGVLLYEMIVGRTPFSGDSVQATLDAQLNQTPVPPHEVVFACPRALSDVVMSALAKSPDERPQSAVELREQLLAAMPIAAASRSTASFPALPETPALERDSGYKPIRLTPEQTKRPKRTTRLSQDFGPGRVWIGRESELQQVVEFLTGRGDARVLLVRGPVGVGKARLVREAAARCADKATTVLAAPDPSGLRAPWYPVLSALEAVLRIETPRSYEDLSRAAARVGLPDRDVPGLAEIFALPGPAEALELAVRRREAHAAAARTLEAGLRRSEFGAVCFADVDQYDHPSRELIRRLCESPPGANLRIVLTCARLPRLSPEVVNAAVSVDLGGLSGGETWKLARSLASGTIDVPAQRIYEITGGSPTAVECLTDVLESASGSIDTATPLVDLIEMCVQRLPVRERRVLQAVAVHGTVAPRALVEVSLSEEERAALETSSWAGLLEAGGEEIRLTSQLVADVITACTPADVRRRLHWRALEALGDDAPLGVLAHHAEIAGELARAYRCSLDAGHDAVRRFDDPGAAIWYGRAVAMARDLHARGIPEASSDVVEASNLLAEVLRQSGEPSLAIGVLDEAALFEPSDAQVAYMERQRGLIALLFGSREAAVHHLEASIGRGIRGGDVEHLCQAYLDLADIHAQAGAVGTAMMELEQGIDVLTAGRGLGVSGSQAVLWRLGLRLAQLLLQTQELVAARRVASAALAQARRVGFPHARGRVSALLADICDAAGDRRQALAHRANAIEEMRQLGDRRSTAELLIQSARARAGADTGSGEAASMRVDDALRLAEQLADEIGWPDGGARSQS